MERKNGGSNNKYLPLFETKVAKGRKVYQLYAISVFVGICLIFLYRATHLPAAGRPGRWAWIGLLLSDLWFSLYWVLTQFVRWNPIFRSTFKHCLSQRYEAADLPGVDIFVCTADPRIEPPLMVVNTVLSVMAYNYPPEKLSVYISDDGGSELILYALIEAAGFSRQWLPFCKKFKVEPRAPSAYFSISGAYDQSHDPILWASIKKLYKEMKDRIETATKLGRIPDEIRDEHKAFREWNSISTQDNHQAIIQILIDGRDSMSLDIEGQILPTLVYVAREKRVQHHHNFKAGAMNALIRISSMISNGSVILNVDCDMYSNNSESVRDAMCFFMDEDKGPEIAYVQFSQSCDNLTRHDMYASCFRVPNELEMGGLDANGGPCYIGSSCFHRRDALCGAKYINGNEEEWKRENDGKENASACVLQERCKVLASCSFEKNSGWGKEIGLKYGFPTEDFVTGLAIQCRGWKSAYFNPGRQGFMGAAPTTLLQSLVQHTRWSEGHFKIGLSRSCPFLYGHKKIPLKLQFSYISYLFWAPNSLPTLVYAAIPTLCLFRGIPLFPKISSLWILPFLYVIVTQYAYSLGEFICCGGTIKGWWNEQRMWLFRRTTSYFFAFLETMLRQLGFPESEFIVTPKVVEDDVYKRYMKEVMEFGSPSPMFTMLATLAVLNLFGFIWGLKSVAMDSQSRVLDPMALQIVLCGLLSLINLPVYEGLFIRRDKGSMPTSVTYKSLMLALLACSLALY